MGNYTHFVTDCCTTDQTVQYLKSLSDEDYIEIHNKVAEKIYPNSHKLRIKRNVQQAFEYIDHQTLAICFYNGGKHSTYNFKDKYVMFGQDDNLISFNSHPQQHIDCIRLIAQRINL